MNLTLFDIPFLANAIRIAAVAPASQGILYDTSGSAYESGSYDIFIEYDDGTCPGDGGYGWSGPWVCEEAITKEFDSDVFLSYSSSFIYASGSEVSGSDTGYGWATPWKVYVGL